MQPCNLPTTRQKNGCMQPHATVQLLKHRKSGPWTSSMLASLWRAKAAAALARAVNANRRHEVLFSCAVLSLECKRSLPTTD